MQYILIHVELERQRGKGEGVEPDTAEGEGSEDAITFVDVICTRAATVGEDGVGDARWRSAVKAVKSGDAVRRRRGSWLPVTGYAPSRSD